MEQKEYFANLAKDQENYEELYSCPWCNSKRFELWGKQIYEGFCTVECLDCRIVYVKRRFNALGRKRLCEGYMEVRQNTDRAKKREKAHDLELSFIYRYITKGRVLDVGCGGGYMLERMPEKLWGKWGTELGYEAANRARNVLNTDKIFIGEVEHIDLPIGHFDLVIARGVIEHVPSPQSFLQRISSLVRPEGYLFMSGPNLDSFCARFYKERWNLHYPEAHLFHFSLKHLNSALVNHGFQLVADAYHYLETPYAQPEKDILHIASDILALREGRPDQFSSESPPFFGNRYTAIWKKYQ